MTGDQKRSAERTTTHRNVVASFEGEDEGVEVPLVNLSATGLQLSVGEPVEVGAILRIEVLPERTIKAVTRWSREDDLDFLLGAEWLDPLTVEDVWKIRSFGVS